MSDSETRCSPPAAFEHLEPSASGVSTRRVLAHSLALAALLLALLPILNNGRVAFPDEGLYTAQADALSAGSWIRERAAPRLDKDGRWTALSNSTIVGNAEIPYARRPFYPILITPFWAVGGLTGVLISSILGTWMAATFGGLITRMIRPKSSIMALWLIGMCTPLFLYAYLAVGHSLVAGFAAVTVWTSLTCLRLPDVSSRRRTTAWIALASLSVVPLTLVRTEGAIVAICLGAATIISSVSRSRRRIRVRPRSAFLAAALAGTAIVVYFINTIWAHTITRLQQGDLDVNARHPDVMSSIWSELFKPWFGDARSASTAGVLVLVVAILAPVALRVLPRFRLLGLGILSMGAVAAISRAAEVPDLISGLLPAAPWLVVGMLSLRRRDLVSVESRVLALASVGACAAILITSYGGGGAAEWGGRFFHVLLPIVGPLAAVGLASMSESLPRLDRKVFTGAVAVMAIGMSVAAGRALHALHDDTALLSDIVMEAATITDSKVVAYTMLDTDGSTRMLWPLQQDGVAVLAAPGLPGFKFVLDGLPADQRQMTFLTNVADRAFLEHLVSKANDPSWKVTGVSELNRTDLTAVSVSRDH